MPPYNKKIYKSYNFQTKRGIRWKKNKAKWRQQKLAVGTVKNIAREIAQQEDKKNMRKYVHVTQFKAAAFNWEVGYLAHLPLPQFWDTITGGDNLTYKSISDVGGNIGLVEMIQNSTAPAKNEQLELRIHGLEIFGVMKNNASYPTRVEIRVLYIPNTNVYTDDANDYLTPRFTMFCRRDGGVGALQRQGYDHRSLGGFSATGNPIRYTELGRKVIYLPTASVSGTLTFADNIQPPVTAPHALQLAQPTVYKRFSIKKYFKTPKTAYCRGTNPQLSNGNYFVCVWCDLPAATNTISFLASCNLQYSVKAPMNQDNV